MATLLACKDIQVEFPTKRVFEGVTLSVNDGDRIGIVGRNGDGKSTLLSVFDGTAYLDEGEVVRLSSATVGTLKQTDSFNEQAAVKQCVIGEAPEHTWAADRGTREIIQMLIGDISWEAKIATLSGGQRRRVDLARLLIGNWDVLLLDEPTNHLDMHAITWLAEHLKQRWRKDSGALLVVTHDRWFLDEVCLSMWEVHDATVDAFEGGYSAYIMQRVERDRLVHLAEQKRQNLMRKELAWLSRGAQARSTKPKFHVEAARALIANEPPVRNSLELKQMAMTRLGKQVIELKQVTERFGEATILDGIDWLIGPGDRYGILGENGTGKTTLLKVILGALQPTSGTVKIGKTVKMAFLSQRLEELDEAAHDYVREVLGRYKSRLIVDGKSVTSAKLLERLGFDSRHLQARVSELSGGQKRRLQLLLILLEEPNVLILDEPGNDMDTDMLAAIEDLLDSWSGTLLLVSHDRHLMERVTDHQYALIDGKIRHMPGGVDEYLRIVDASDAFRAEPTSSQKSNLKENQTSKLSGGEIYEAKKQLASTERKLESLQLRIEEAEQQLSHLDPSDYQALTKHGNLLSDLKEDQASLEAIWLDLSEKLDQ